MKRLLFFVFIVFVIKFFEAYKSKSPKLAFNIVTEYADGTKVYVNFNYTAYNEGGVSIAARDYKVVR